MRAVKFEETSQNFDYASHSFKDISVQDVDFYYE